MYGFRKGSVVYVPAHMVGESGNKTVVGIVTGFPTKFGEPDGITVTRGKTDHHINYQLEKVVKAVGEK